MGMERLSTATACTSEVKPSLQRPLTCCLEAECAKSVTLLHCCQQPVTGSQRVDSFFFMTELHLARHLRPTATGRQQRMLFFNNRYRGAFTHTSAGLISGK